MDYFKFNAGFFLQNLVCFSRSKDIQILVSLISENLLYHHKSEKGAPAGIRDVEKSKRFFFS
jgi:hypothetical protein